MSGRASSPLFLFFSRNFQATLPCFFHMVFKTTYLIQGKKSCYLYKACTEFIHKIEENLYDVESSCTRTGISFHFFRSLPLSEVLSSFQRICFARFLLSLFLNIEREGKNCKNFCFWWLTLLYCSFLFFSTVVIFIVSFILLTLCFFF